MRMTIRVADKMVKELLFLTSAKTKTEAISLAIADFLKRKGKEKLLPLKGKLNLSENWKEWRDAELNER